MLIKKIEMKKILVLISVCIFLINCASVNPYGVPEGEGAILQSTTERNGKAKYIYRFKTVTTGTGTKKPLFVPKIIIPPGEIMVGVTIKYYYKGSYLELSLMQQVKVDLMAWDLSYESQAEHDYYHNGIGIHVLNDENWKGIKFDALKGETYHVNSRIENGKAFIWIEVNKGEKVSEIVRGYGLRFEDYWLWETLPDPAE